MIVPLAPTPAARDLGPVVRYGPRLQRASASGLPAPYFVPDEAVIKALQLAALRGVDVRILTSGKGDSMAVHLAAFHYIHCWTDSASGSTRTSPASCTRRSC